MYVSAEFSHAENNPIITREDYPEFYHELQRAVLLSLKNAGSLTQIQYREAEKLLNRQKPATASAKNTSGGKVD